jgi:two-component system nitrogen regulation response regulator GlnG
MEHDWPGNVRELENLIKRAVIVARGETIGLSLIREIGFRPTSGSKNQMNPVESTVRKWFLQRRQMPFARDAFHKELIAAVEKTLIQESLLASDFNQVRAARLLGMNRTTLRKKMEEYGLKSVG